MDTSPLEALEAKVGRVVERISTLQAENDELKKTNQDLDSRCHELQKELKESKRSLKVLESERSKWNEGNKEKEDQIRSKVSSLLEKLEEWEE